MDKCPTCGIEKRYENDDLTLRDKADRLDKDMHDILMGLRVLDIKGHMDEGRDSEMVQLLTRRIAEVMMKLVHILTEELGALGVGMEVVTDPSEIKEFKRKAAEKAEKRAKSDKSMEDITYAALKARLDELSEMARQAEKGDQP